MLNDPSPPEDTSEITTLTAQIVSAHVSRNAIGAGELPALIQSVFDSLTAAKRGQSTALVVQEPAVAVKLSVKQDHIVCLECGKSFSMLKRHLNTDHQLTPFEYRQKWKLPLSYPLVSPNYAQVRSALAKQIGLGRKAGTVVRSKTALRKTEPVVRRIPEKKTKRRA